MKKIIDFFKDKDKRGLPLLKGAVAGLFHEFDIKADLPVSIALVADVINWPLFSYRLG